MFLNSNLLRSKKMVLYCLLHLAMNWEGKPLSPHLWFPLSISKTGLPGLPDLGQISPPNLATPIVPSVFPESISKTRVARLGGKSDPIWQPGSSQPRSFPEIPFSNEPTVTSAGHMGRVCNAHSFCVSMLCVYGWTQGNITYNDKQGAVHRRWLSQWEVMVITLYTCIIQFWVDLRI